MSEPHDDLWDLYEFLIRRLDEQIRIAEETGDEAARASAQGSRRILTGMGRDLVDRPWGRPEVSRFLLRAASRYRRHPEFRQAWVWETAATTSSQPPSRSPGYE